MGLERERENYMPIQVRHHSESFTSAILSNTTGLSVAVLDFWWATQAQGDRFLSRGAHY